MSHNKDLLNYILQSKRHGISEMEIRKSLEEAGWNQEDIGATFESLGAMDRGVLHLHLFHRHVPLGISIFVLTLAIGAAIFGPTLYFQSAVGSAQVVLPNEAGKKIEFQYGSWPALENAGFFQKVKQSLLSERTNFIEADLSAMLLRVYKRGELAKEVPILSKGKSGSWWETPAGVYQVEAKEKSHYSSFGHVYMPWSMQFQGNFFIHGWPYYENGDPVAKGYSGGCIRLADEDAKSVFSLADVGMPVLVSEKFLNNSSDTKNFTYALKQPQISAASYLAADLGNNFVFADYNSANTSSIASITKLMTALTAVEYINVEHEVTIDPLMIIDTTVPRLKAGNRFSVLDLLSVLLMESSNEAAKAVAAPLGESRFVNLMNSKAAAIGMKNSVFTDTSGVDYGNVSTVQDLFALAKYLYYNRSFVLSMSMGTENRAAYGPSAFQNLKNFNEIPETRGLVGGKIGLNRASGESMLSIYDIDIGGEKRPIVIIVLGSTDEKKDVAALFNYIQSNYKEVVTKIALDKGETP